MFCLISGNERLPLNSFICGFSAIHQLIFMLHTGSINLLHKLHTLHFSPDLTDEKVTEPTLEKGQ